MSVRRLLLFAVLALGACRGRARPSGGPVTAADAGIGDLGLGDLGGGAGLRGAFTIAGCATLSADANGPRCSGRAPLELTFVPLGEGATEQVWSFDGGLPATSQDPAPTIQFGLPGTYAVTLALGSAAGTTLSAGTVVVTAGQTGAPCAVDADCDTSAGLSCLCGSGQDGGVGCPGGLGAGFCTRDCGIDPCAPGEICADLTRGGAPDGGTGNQSFRRALCVPGCAAAADCPSGLLCRSLPALAPGVGAGGVYTWRTGCFAGVLADDGSSCLAASGMADPSACLSGRCDPFGARGLCGSVCPSPACPAGTSCGSLAGPVASTCLRSCDDTHPCGDPFLTCATPGQMGAISFSVVGAPAGARYCVPQSCTQASDCLLGACDSESGVSLCRGL